MGNVEGPRLDVEKCLAFLPRGLSQAAAVAAPNRLGELSDRLRIRPRAAEWDSPRSENKGYLAATFSVTLRATFSLKAVRLV